MNNISLNFEDVTFMGLWGGKITDLPPQMMNFLFENFQINNSNLRIKSLKEDTKNNFPITYEPSKINPNLLERLNNISDLNFKQDLISRLKYSIGKSYWDLLRIKNGKIRKIVDGVVFPSSRNALIQLIQVANEENFIIIPSGGNSSVTEPLDPPNDNRVVIAANLSLMNKVIKILPESHLVITEPGILLPDLDQVLKTEGLQLGHSPQSYIHTSVGGAISSKGAGQLSSGFGTMADMVNDLKIELPMGTVCNRKFLVPESAVGPRISEIFLGSEGALGIISEATLKVKPIQNKLFKAFLFKSFHEGVNAIRNVYQNGIRPTIIRFSDNFETSLFFKLASDVSDTILINSAKKILPTYLKLRGFQDKDTFLLILMFEGPKQLNKTQAKIASKICKKYGGVSITGMPAKAWYKDRYNLPFYREKFFELGILVDTLETATTWEKIDTLYSEVMKKLKKYCKVRMAHISHVYEQGASLYFTFMAEETFNWQNPLIFQIRQEIVESFLINGGTISHHHGVGSAYKNFLPKERDQITLFLLKKIKNALDPKNIMNPSSGLLE
ncbi:MAG: FAD-binding oxidoreductase [Candidatus Thorarchaeota archaeon]